MPDSSIKSRLDFIENGSAKPLKIEETAPLNETTRYPLLARYDFAGTGPRPGIKRDAWLFQHASGLQTVGERIRPRVVRIGWLVLQLAVTLGFLYFVLQGNTFNCAGREVVFR